VAELLDYARQELAEAEANDDAEAIARLQHDVLDLQAKRLELDRRKETTTVLTNRRTGRAAAAVSTTGGND
jgi:hypothetical protein